MTVINFGDTGRLISPSKTSYRMNNPDNEVYFDANLVTRSKGRIWWGDIDLTLDREQLQRFANLVGEEVFLFHEKDVMDDNKIVPFDKAVASFVPVDIPTISLNQ